MTEIVAIHNDVWQVGLLPTTGGSVAYGRVRIGDAWVDVLRPTPAQSLADAWASASFPLVPWSNRIRAGVFDWAGQTHRLRVNFADGTAIHGTALEFPWTVVEQSDTAVVMEFSCGAVAGVNWPWAFTTRFGYALEGDRFTWHMSITNDDAVAFPAGFGHHPYFVRELGVGSPVRLQLNCDSVYPAVGCLPTGDAQPVDARVDFRQLRPLGEEFVDDCFAGRSSSTLATLDYADAVTVAIEADALLEHAVVYIPQGEEFFAVEPVSNVNDGFNRADAGASGTGVFVVEPGQTCSASFALIAQPHEAPRT